MKASTPEHFAFREAEITASRDAHTTCRLGTVQNARRENKPEGFAIDQRQPARHTLPDHLLIKGLGGAAESVDLLERYRDTPFS
jgi:hypothetical protein